MKKKRLIELLEEIIEGKGAYSLDRLEHASNTIKNMKSLAKEALEIVKNG